MSKINPAPKAPVKAATNAATKPAAPNSSTDDALSKPDAGAPPSGAASPSNVVVLSTRKLPDGKTSRVLMDATRVWKDVV